MSRKFRLKDKTFNSISKKPKNPADSSGLIPVSAISRASRSALEILLSIADIDVILENIYKIFTQYVNCDRYTILYINDKGRLYAKYDYGCVKSIRVGMESNYYKPNGDVSYVYRCLQEGKIYIDNNDYSPNWDINISLLTIPLTIFTEKIGVLLVENLTPGHFMNLDKNLLQEFSIYMSIALKNGERLLALTNANQEIEALYEQSASFNEILKVTNDELRKAKEELSEKNLELLVYNQEVENAYLNTVLALANSIEASDIYTRGHCERVMEISCKIGNLLELDETRINNLKYAAILHDIGKIGISHHLLNKAGILTDEEYHEIQRHPLIAYNILKDVTFLSDSLKGILQHHERYDGKGYPHGIKGSETSIEGKILCLADAFDAMTSDRPYRKRMPVQYVIEEIEKNTGSQFDPEIAKHFIKMIKSSTSDSPDLL